jgi:23S rRNA pseudouridine1911/1915/1917 synthase
MAVRRFVVPGDAPVRLDAFLARELPSFSRVELTRLLEQGRVRVNGKKAKPMRRIFGGEAIELDLPVAVKPPQVDGVKLRVLADTEQLLVIDKQSGLVVEPEPGQVSVVQLAASQFKDFDVGGVAAPGVAHRIDKDTTGCLALAKTDAALASLKAAFEAKRVDKVYLALVCGTPPDSKQLDTPYGRDPSHPRRYSSMVSSARRARLSFRTLERFDGFALCEVTLDTGRTHQIRAQLCDQGFPVVGDTLYGQASDFIGRVALHATRLRIEGVGELVDVTAPLPADFEAALAKLR